MGAGPAIRARRLALGRSLEDVSAATRIPVQHLESLEEDRPEDLPAGPYASVWLRAVRRELALSDGSSEEDDEPVAAPPSGAPLWMVRAIAVTSLFGLLVVLASYGWDRVSHLLTLARPLAAPLDQTLVVTSQRSTRLRVVVDGASQLDGPVVGGQRLEFVARDRLELEVPAMSDVKLQWNGQEIVPQGRQDAPRTLVFVDDDDGSLLGVEPR